MNELEKMYHEMLSQLEAGITDLEKFEAGNNSAGTRVRKTMQNIKDLAQRVRVEVQEQKNSVEA